MVSDFLQPELHLRSVDARTVADLVCATADLALVVGGDDVIRDLSHNLRDLSAARIPSWRGKPIEHVVRGESHSVLTSMLGSARDGKPARRFDVSHLLEGGRDLPMRYSALSIGGDGQVILVGRDLRPVAELQSQLLSNRQSLEQNAKRQRQSEAHYRLLFETASEAILIVDAETGKIRDANPRAAALLGSTGAELGGKRLSAILDRSRQAEVNAMLARVLASGAPTTFGIAASGDGRRLSMAAELFRAGDLKLVLLRLSVEGEDGDAGAAPDANLGDLVRHAAEAVLLADEDGRVLWTNESFLALAGIPLAAHAVGKPLSDFFHWNGIEEEVLLANVRRHGRVPMFSGTVRGANGQSTEVELSAVARTEGPQPGYAFVMRTRSDDDAGRARGNSDLMRTAENLVEMIGRVPMKDMVRDTTDVIERMCIEAALKLTGNNRASAARVLGLSRQALYLKMNRFGIDDEE